MKPMTFTVFMKRCSLAMALLCAFIALTCIFRRNWIEAMQYVVLTGLNHFAYNLWKKQQIKDEQRKNQKDR